MKTGFALFCYVSLLLPSLVVSALLGNSINTTHPLKDGNTLASPDSTFQLGFFSPTGFPTRRYLGLWYTQSPDTIPWIANRKLPLNSSQGVLQMSSEGILHLVDENGTFVWSSNVSGRAVSNPIAQLLNSGNFVLKDKNDDNPDNYLWQSFDYPGDTLIPGMKIGVNKKTGHDIFLSAWKSSDDPSIGDSTYGLDISTLPQVVIKWNSSIIWRSGPWNGYIFTGFPEVLSKLSFDFQYVSNDEEVYLIANPVKNSTISKIVLLPQGTPTLFTWTGSWTENVGSQMDACDFYGTCGTYGLCKNDNSPLCSCLNGFKPMNDRQWEFGNGTSGCVRKTRLDCVSDGFQKVVKVKAPDTMKYWSSSSTNLKECRKLCLKNCSCTAYSNLDVRGKGSGCLQWFVDLIDIRTFPETGQDYFVRIAASDMEATDDGNTNKRMWIVLGISLFVAVLMIAVVVFYWRNKYGFPKTNPKDGNNYDLELPLFDLAILSSATNGFSYENKLGEGGFGPVYKGIFKDGQEIAVKRLSKESKQGLDEFKNEVSHIAKLQHRNLVKLLGCCIDGTEKLLVYEFMPNKSLDFFLFDEERNMSLKWPQRYHIINGIARGILYLHQDSRLRIIHRDLKAENILLDLQMNPKISDFGLARSFGEMETKAATKKVIGTYGYMSPEYALDGVYSVKSDVFSYGVLVLEIVSGRRNRGFYHPDHCHNLLGHAWRLFCEGRQLELVSESIRDSCNLSQVFRSIHIGLLCVQRSPLDRPTMAEVVLMMGTEGRLPQPMLPGFFSERDLVDTTTSSSTTSTSQKTFAPHEYLITVLEGR
ncbi:G-type lectin S-receptor-like serine/threonine-protein kinase At4g27290 [Rutidosis leptorrhynchoides]|uniref:G-type lectin S-receptor-like serine/threonine-protein kinase At4g27290 n=1 Tax=Rutidosis leptorrhynchoides TaxID=125765 RepID=UPI003A999381